MTNAQTTTVRTKVYRGIEIQFWKSGSRWFAHAPGQSCDDDGYQTVNLALEQTEKFIDQLAT
jgi:hypothetical protein